MSRTSAPRTKPEAAAPSPPFAPEPEVHLLSAEETREETRALIARAMRSAARFVEAHPQHENTPQLLSVLSEFYGTTCEEAAKATQQNLVAELAPQIIEMIGQVMRQSSAAERVMEQLEKESKQRTRGAARQPTPSDAAKPAEPSSETPPSEEPPQTSASAPVIVHLTKDAA